MVLQVVCDGHSRSSVDPSMQYSSLYTALILQWLVKKDNHIFTICPQLYSSGKAKAGQSTLKGVFLFLIIY